MLMILKFHMLEFIIFLFIFLLNYHMLIINFVFIADYLKEMVYNFHDVALGNFCKILAVTLSELDMYEHKTSCKNFNLFYCFLKFYLQKSFIFIYLFTLQYMLKQNRRKVRIFTSETSIKVSKFIFSNVIPVHCNNFCIISNLIILFTT